MKSILAAVALSMLVAGCGGPVVRLNKLGRVRAAVLTDANGFSATTSGTARPPIEVTDPDRLAALDRFLKARGKSWQKLEGAPRATRYQLQLMGDDGPLYTLWLETGYVAMAEGKRLQDTRLTFAETAELLACLGLPPDYLGPPSRDSGPPRSGVADGPRGMGGFRGETRL